MEYRLIHPFDLFKKLQDAEDSELLHTRPAETDRFTFEYPGEGLIEIDCPVEFRGVRYVTLASLPHFNTAFDKEESKN